MTQPIDITQYLSVVAKNKGAVDNDGSLLLQRKPGLTIPNGMDIKEAHAEVPAGRRCFYSLSA